MDAPADRFARFVATLGRGPGRSRALTREEAREACAMVLAGEAEPVQVGAFLMLLRYRGEDAAEIAGLVEAIRARAGIGTEPIGAALDWPSYGAGRTRGAPWFLLSALAVARAGCPVLMHGSNDFSTGQSVPEALAALGQGPANNLSHAARLLRSDRFAYLPLGAFSPELEGLLGLRRLLGLRSPMNSAARLLDPGNAPCGVDGVFHPPYIEVHLGVAALLGRPRLLVLKGGGGEAERTPAKPVLAHLWDGARGRSQIAFAAGETSAGPDDEAGIADVWRGAARPPRVLATILATIAMALMALGQAADPTEADRAALSVWDERAPV
jgi:anthranilate phosphoribosyltransferase